MQSLSDTVNTEDVANSVGRLKAKKLSASGGQASPQHLTRGSAPGWAYVPRPRYRLALPRSPWAPHSYIASDAPEKIQTGKQTSKQTAEMKLDDSQI